jgi:hypothetical protein
MAPHLILQIWWSKTASHIETRTTSDADLARLEARYDIELPPDFRQYLSEGVPTVEKWDDNDGTWWPIERIRNIPEEYEHAVGDPVAQNAAKHLFFLDCSFWCWAWAISCADDETYGKVALVGSNPAGYVADSFTEFVERYTSNWDLLCQLPRVRTPIDRFRAWLLRD